MHRLEDPTVVASNPIIGAEPEVAFRVFIEAAYAIVGQSVLSGKIFKTDAIEAAQAAQSGDPQTTVAVFEQVLHAIVD